jgi:16S rRNA (cytosine1402-N4)-methyltransferase
MGASTGATNAVGHTPVLYQQVLSALQPSAGARYIDGTIGAGGHAIGILEASAPDGQLLGLDRDSTAVALTTHRLEPFGKRTIIQQGTFAEMASHATSIGWYAVQGVLLDLGLSSMQVEDASRGFSFRLEGPLDMRFDSKQPLTAADLVNGLPEDDLADIFARFGEEPRARHVAKAIIAARPLHTTIALVDVIAPVAGRARKGIHPATRAFQALRIAVNDELKALESGLEHSLEDRIVKRFIRQESQDCICPPERLVCTCGHRARLRTHTRRPIRPDEREVQANPRARSARLRVAERLEVA